MEKLSLSPEAKAYRGIRDGDYGRWDDVGDDAAVTRDKLLQASAAAMRGSFDPAALDESDALSFELFNAQAARAANTLIGAVYLVLGVLGLFITGDSALNVIALNGADNGLHLVIGAVLVAVGMSGRR